VVENGEVVSLSLYSSSSLSTSSSSEVSSSEGMSSPRDLAIVQVALWAYLLCLCARNYLL
jgi:hypothetical protein